MGWLEDIKKRLSSPDDDKRPLREKVKQADLSSQLVGKGPTPPFRSTDEKSRAELDTGIAAYRDLEDKPVMTKEKFKQTVQLAERGSPEAQAMINKLQTGKVTSANADDVYDRYFQMKKE